MVPLSVDIYSIHILQAESGCFVDGFQKLYSDCFIADVISIGLRSILNKNASLFLCATK